jgi:hypothetical protein
MLSAVLASTVLGLGFGPRAVLGQASDDSSTTVTVQNERDDKITVFLERVASAGHIVLPTRLGEVEPMSTATLAVPDWAVEQAGDGLNVILHVEGQGDLEPARFIASPGGDFGIIAVEHDELSETIAAPTVEPGQASVTVLNNRAESVMVLVEEIAAGREAPVHILLGTAAPNSETTMPIPSVLVEDADEVRFVLHPAGGVDLPTQVLTIGDEARLKIMVP